jgi:hypothetical protein
MNNTTKLIFKEQNIQFDNDKVFRKLHTSTLMDKILENIRRKLMEKYLIDYVGFMVISSDQKYILDNMGQDIWHEYNWNTKCILLCPHIPKGTLMHSGEEGIVFFPNVITNFRGIQSDFVQLRASIIGEVKYGFIAMLHNDDNGNKVLLSLTFANGHSLSTLDYKTYKSFIKDLKQAVHLMDPFLEYFMLTGQINDSPQLEKIMTNYSKSLIYSI